MKRYLPIFSLLVFSTLLFSTSASAEIYKWVDENGKTHFGDKQDTKTATDADASKAEVVEIKEANAYVADEEMRKDLELMSKARQEAEEKAKQEALEVTRKRKVEEAQKEAAQKQVDEDLQNNQRGIQKTHGPRVDF